MLESYIVASVIIAFSSLSLGIFVYLRDRGNVVNLMYFLLNVSIAIWSFGFMIATMIAPNKTIALFGARICNFNYILMSVFFLHFVLALLKINKLRRKILYLAYAANFLMLILIFTELYIKGITEPKMVFKYYIIPGVLYPLVVLVFLICIGYAYYELFKGYKRSAGIVRNQIKYVVIASTIGFSGGSTLFLPVFNIDVYPIGYFLIFLNSVVIAYAIIRHRLMDINIIFKKGATYAYASFLLLIPLSLLVIYGQKAAFETVSYSFSVSMLCALVLSAYFFPKVKVRAEKTVEHYIFKNKYDYKKTISDLSKAMVSILNTDDLCKKIITTITETMMVKKASIYILNEEKGVYELHESMDLTGDEIISSYQKDDPVLVWIERHNEIFIREELERYTTDNEALAVAERMKQMKSEICIPLITKQKLRGVINLGMKGNREMYNNEDLGLLTTLSNQAAVAIENATLYEDLSKTKVQMQRADRLASLGTLTAGLAHEIRNPLVAIKTFTQLLPTRFDDDEFRNHFLKVTAGEVDRISSLVSELLDFSRPSQPKLNKENLNQVLEKMLLLVDTESHKKSLQIIKNFNEFLPPVVLDKEQIKQVFLNVLLNAVYATPESGTITVETRLTKRDGSQNFVQVIIKDTGKGISEENMDKIFTPFYTTKHEGSGLGLAISNQIIQEHQGSIEVESKENQGTTFYVNLPVNPLLIQGEKQWRQENEKNVSH
jgi:two-component system NtrC family sensor kinase